MSRARRMLATVVSGLVVLVALSAPAAAEPIQVLRSPGGLEFWLIEDHAIPVVSLTVTFRRGGAAGDPDPLAGRAELVSTLLDEGAGHMDGPAFQERMRDLAAEMRARVGLDEFSVSLRMLSRNRQESVKLLHLALSRPRFDDQAVDRMRAQALAGLRREATRPAAIARTLWYRTAFPDHPYGRPVSGSEQTLNAMTVADLRAFVADRLTRDRLVIGIAGDVTPDEARGLVDLAFGDLPAHGAGDPLPPAAVAAAGQTLIVDHSSPQATILTGQLGLRRDDPDWYAALVMNHILGGGSFTSRLYSSVREESGLAYSVDSYLVAFDEVGVLQATAATANATAGDALNRMRAEWRRLATTPPTAEEVEAAQDFLVGSFPLTLTSTTRIAATLAGLQIETLGADYLQRREGLIRRVTAADVARVARRLLQPDRLLTVVVGAPAGVTGEVVDSD